MTNSASEALGLPGASAQAGAPGSGAGDGSRSPALETPADVWAMRAQLLADPEFRARFEAGSPEARVKMNQVMSLGTRWAFGDSVNLTDLGPKVAEQVAAQRAEQVAVFREQQVDDLRRHAALGPDVEQMVRTGTSVTAEEKRLAESERDRLLHDESFVKRLRANDSEAKSRWALLQIIRSAPLKAA